MPTKDRHWKDEIAPSDVVLASFDALRDIRQTGCKAFVWPDEGAFVDGQWQFNEAHEGEFEPLLIDLQTSLAMTLIYNALNEANQARFKDWVAKHRGNFASLFEFCWQRVTLKRAG